MLLHSLKMIWAERKSNTWIFIELILIFTILWFCSGFMYKTGKQFLFEPVGVDINHTYILHFDIQKNINIEDYPKDYDYPQDGITIMERLKQYPAIENACFSSYYATPYTGSYIGNSIFKDSTNYSYWYRCVSPEFFDVFRIKFQSGRPFDANEILSKNQRVASPKANNIFFPGEDITLLKEITDVKFVHGFDYDFKSKSKEEIEKAIESKTVWKVTGVTDKIKRSEVEAYQRIIFFPLSREDLNPRKQVDFCIRVKPKADKNFIETFRKEMSERLKVGPFELVSTTPLSTQRSEYLRDTIENIETMTVVIAFLLINVFLGIVGTFRFRANARRGEIGLRCAMGSSKAKIQQLLLGETFVLLLLASIPATILALNIQYLGILSKLGVSILESTNVVAKDKSMILPNLINYLITFGSMLIIIWMGTWYPAKKALEIQPAEALHYE
jgi:putative ABC transport system permease protein